MWRHLAVSLAMSLFIGTKSLIQGAWADADYDTVSCNFQHGNLCNTWSSSQTSSHNLVWEQVRHTGNRYAQLNTYEEDDESSGALFSPWLEAVSGYSCYMNFRYYITCCDKCRLTLFHENATHYRSELCNKTISQHGYLFSTSQNVEVDCNKEPYRIVFEGERVSDGCIIYIDTIVFNMKRDNHTSLPTTPTSDAATATLTTTTTPTSRTAPAEQDSTDRPVSSGSTVTGNSANNMAVEDVATGGLDSGAIAGIAVVVVILVVVSVVIVVVISRRKGGGVTGQCCMMGFFKGVRNKPTVHESHSTHAVTNSAYLADHEHISGAAATLKGDNSGTDHVYRNVSQSVNENANTSHASNADMDSNKTTRDGTSQANASRKGRQEDYELATLTSGSADSCRKHQYDYKLATHGPNSKAPAGSEYQLTKQPSLTSHSGEAGPDYYNQKDIDGPALKGQSPSQNEDPRYNHLNTRPVNSEDPGYNHIKTHHVNTTSATSSAPAADDTYYHALEPYDQHADEYDQHDDAYHHNDDTYDQHADAYDQHTDPNDPTTLDVQRDSDGYTLAATTSRNLPAPKGGDSVYALADTAIYEVEEDDDPQPSVYEDACNHLDVTRGSANTPDVKPNDQDDYNHLGVKGGSPKTSDVHLDNQETYSHLNANQETYSNLQHNDGMRQDAQRTASSDQYSHI